MSHPSRIINLSTARRRFGDKVDRLLPFFRATDPFADGAVHALGTLPQAVSKNLLAHRLDNGIQSAVDPPPAVLEFFNELEHIPFWVDIERCDRGGLAFLRSGILGGLTLGYNALARSYCSAGGNKPLILTGRLVDSAYQRLTDTAQFVYTICQPDALVQGAEGFKLLARVRLLHAQIRLRLNHDPRWQSAAWGVPINQADMAGTVLLFSHVVSSGIRKLGGLFSDTEEEDLLHLWRYAGYLLGVTDELLCTTRHEAAALIEIINLIDAGPDDDSRVLIDAMFDPSIFERNLQHPLLAKSVRALYQAICRFFLDHATSDRVGLPRTIFDFALPGIRTWVRAASLAATLMPFSEQIRLLLGNAYWRQLIDGGRRESSAKQTQQQAELNRLVVTNSELH